MDFKKAIVLTAAVCAAFSFQACYFYKPELPTTKCKVNEECPQGEVCKDDRCEDIYYPKNKIRQY